MYILPGQSRETEKLRGEQEEQETSQNRRIRGRWQKQVILPLFEKFRRTIPSKIVTHFIIYLTEDIQVSV